MRKRGSRSEILTLFFGPYSDTDEYAINKKERGDSMRFDNITLERALWMMEHYPVILIDVREPEKYQKSHLKGAVNIPYDKLSNTSFQKEATYIVYCDNGMQSMRAARDMAIEGCHVYNVIGGIKGNDKYVDM